VVRTKTVLVLSLSIALAGCQAKESIPKFELRWCAYGERDCVLKQKDSAPYVKGGYFFSLDACNDAIRHLSFYGAKLGGACVELTEAERRGL
jgi:hypothetical protein